MKKSIIILFIWGYIIPCIAQEKLLTINDAIIGNNAHMYPELLSQLQWKGKTSNYTYVNNNSLIQGNVKSSKEKEILNLDNLNNILKTQDIKELINFPAYSWHNDNSIRFYNNEHLIVYNLKSKNIALNIKLEDNTENTVYCKESNLIAYTIENNLFIINSSNKSQQITNEDNKGIINGSSYVHRSEFGIRKGSFWSPKGNYLAFYRKDETMVTDYPLVDISQRIATLNNIKYPMAGMKSEEVTMGIYNVKNNNTIFLETGEPKEQYLTNIVWDLSEKYIYIAIVNREQNHMKLNKYDILTGKLIKTLFEEKHEKYVEPEKPMMFLSGKPDEFIWFSERDGYNHLYLYNTEGKLIKQLTKGNWTVTDFLGFDEEENHIFYSSTAESPIERHVYKLNISSGDISKLTAKKGSHTGQFNFSGNYFIDQYSSLTVPRTYYLKNNLGEIIRTLFNAENPMKNFKIGEMTIFTVKANDGITDLYCRMIKPVDFDSTKKYPAIIYVYGGPHSQLVRNTWMGSTWVWQYYMAQKGYVMFTMDNRGTQNRGFEFENIIHRQVGFYETQDQMKGIEYLKNTGFVDTTRIGIHGWSYGGFLTISLLEQYPETFKVGVAGGPVIDWKYYEIMYGERYMDTPQENPEGYEKSAVINYAKNLKGKLMIIQGAIDGTVVWQNSLAFLQKCVEEGILVDYLVYPRHKHNVRGKDRIHLMRKVTQYFDDYLYPINSQTDQ
ncbi:MAG: S9 family peptidase [Bacteroidales bacterium]|nr:S9 family peptidase [Bacteroidales bacterium]